MAKTKPSSATEVPVKDPFTWPLTVKYAGDREFVLEKEKAWIYTGRALKLHIDGKDGQPYTVPRGALVSSDTFVVNAFSRGRRLFQKFSGDPKSLIKPFKSVTVIVPSYSRG